MEKSMSDICAFCKLPIAEDEVTFTDDEGQIMHLDCSESKKDESEDYLEADSDSD